MEAQQQTETKNNKGTVTGENSLVNDGGGSNFKSRNKQSIGTSSDEVTPPPVLGASGMNPVLGNKIYAINTQKEHLDEQQQAILSMPNPKRHITADQFYTQNRNKRMPVELRVGVTMVGSKAIDFNGNDALAQPESP